MKRKPRELERFFAVTLTSVYEVVAKGERGLPYAKKIKLGGESAIAVGGIITDQMVAVAKWLQFYIPEGHGWGCPPMTSFERRLEQVNMQWWGGRTTAIIALFLTRKNAEKCFSSPDPQLCDPRWLQETKKVIEAIGEDHPTFTVCHSPGLALFDELTKTPRAVEEGQKVVITPTNMASDDFIGKVGKGIVATVLKRTDIGMCSLLLPEGFFVHGYSKRINEGELKGRYTMDIHEAHLTPTFQ